MEARPSEDFAEFSEPTAAHWKVFDLLKSSQRLCFLAVFLAGCSTTKAPEHTVHEHTGQGISIQFQARLASDTGMLSQASHLLTRPETAPDRRKHDRHRVERYQRSKTETFSALMELTLCRLSPNTSEEAQTAWAQEYRKRCEILLRNAWQLIYYGGIECEPVSPDTHPDLPEYVEGEDPMSCMGTLDERLDVALAQYSMAQIAARRGPGCEQFETMEAQWKTLIDTDLLRYGCAMRRVFEEGVLPLRSPKSLRSSE